MKLRLGDKVEKVIETVVPKVILDEVKKHDCGCSKRKEWLNKLDEE